MTDRHTLTRRDLLGALGAAALGGGAAGRSRAQTTTTQGASGSWPQAGYDAARTGYNPGATELGGGLGRAWTFRTLSREGPWSLPVIDGERMVVGSRDANIYCLDTTDGRERWSVETDGEVKSTAAIADGTAYIARSDATLLALDLADGSEQWTYEHPKDHRNEMQPAFSDGTLFLPGPKALDPADGSVLWEGERDIGTTGVAVAGGSVYATNGGTNLVVAWNATDGTRQWEARIDGRTKWPTQPVVADGRLFVVADAGNTAQTTAIHALDTDSGETLWSFDTGETENKPSTPAVVDGTVVYGYAPSGENDDWISNTSGGVYGIDADTGEQSWHVETPGAAVPPPVGTGQTVYVGSFGEGSGAVTAIAAGSGSVRWEFQTRDDVTGLALAGDRLYVVREDGFVVALSESAGTPGGTGTGTGGGGGGGDSSTISDGLGRAELAGLATAGVAVLGAAAYRRFRTRDGDAGDGAVAERQASGDSGSGSSTPPSNGSPDGSAGPPAAVGEPTPSDGDDDSDGDVFTQVQSNIETGETRRTDARTALENQNYEAALQAYADATDAYERARRQASDTSLIDTGELDRRLDALEDGREQVHRQRISSDISDIRAALEEAKMCADDGAYRAADAKLDPLDDDLDEVEQAAAGHGFDTLASTIADLRERWTDQMEAVSDQLEDLAGPPERIPAAPDGPVKYAALTDEGTIGTGGNADVRLGTYSRDGEQVQVAVKEPRVAGTLHADAVDRLLAEAETWDKLDDHDHIVGVVDYGSEPLPWIAMEYMDGGNLGERGVEMGFDQALWTSLSVIDAVVHAHRRGVAHLDLKPANVLFRTVEEGWDVPKVGDWGLSKHLLDHSKSVEGLSPHYAAPEQFDEDYGITDDITDVYQLGAVCYELFTGRPPFEGNAASVMRQVLSETPPAPTEVNPALPQELDEVLLTALAKEKADRYDHVVYLRDALEDLPHTVTEDDRG